MYRAHIGVMEKKIESTMILGILSVLGIYGVGV